MKEWFRGKWGGAAAFVVICALVAGGLGWATAAALRLEGEQLAAAYASADLFLFASQTDTFGNVILEAQASGLPVIAVDAGGPASLIEHGETGLLAAPRPQPLADAIVALAGAPLLRERLRRAALAAVQSRTWEAALEQLAAGYRMALTEHAAGDRQVA